MKLSFKTKIITAFILSFCLYLVYIYWSDINLERGFNKISKGDSVQQLKALAGEPSYIFNDIKQIGTEYPSLKKEGMKICENEFLYRVSYSPLPSVWSYCFDSNNKLVKKYHWVSW